MCGRFTITVTIEELLLRYGIDAASSLFHEPRYNIAPGQPVPAVISDGIRNRIGPLMWGLVPEWLGEASKGPPLFNARGETVAEKPAFRTAFRQKRCLVPADSFYEWKKSSDGKRKQPMRILLKDGSLFSMAGLYESWTTPDGRKISTCTVITTTPNELMADIHDRMPVILRNRDDERKWLDKSQKAEQLMMLLQPYPTEEMQAYPVSSTVGNVRNDTEACILRVPELLPPL
ncbi:SOS response-associated peptidase [Paenibacillus hodogayensis]|uniref:Abasic site processing protein n=1 Tax=Paenibacillus hodogayensis TaxID=279208 RepID=A0ABV5W3J6_9BACL